MARKRSVGFPTPETPIGQPVYRGFLIPFDDAGIQALFDGAISLLFEERNFTQDIETNLTAEETAQIYRDIMNIYDLCNLIASCISDPESATSEALQQWLNDNGYNTGNNGVPPTYDQNTAQNTELLDIENCDNLDEIWGQVSAIVEYMNKTITDVAESVTVYENVIDFLANLLGKLPVLAFVTGAITDAWEYIFEAYLGTYTESIAQEYKCELFCKAVESCSLTLDDVVQYFAGKGGTATTDHIQVVKIATELALTGQAVTIVAMLHHLLAVSLASNSAWFGQSLLTFKQVAKNGLADDGHEACSACLDYDFCKVIDFTIPQPEWEILSGSFVSGEGIVSDPLTGIAQVRIDDLGEFTAKLAVWTVKPQIYTPSNEAIYQVRNASNVVTWTRNQNYGDLVCNQVRYLTTTDIKDKLVNRIDITLRHDVVTDWQYVIDYTTLTELPADPITYWSFEGVPGTPYNTPNWWQLDNGVGLADVWGADIGRYLFYGIYLPEPVYAWQDTVIKSITANVHAQYNGVVSSYGMDIAMFKYAKNGTDYITGSRVQQLVSGSSFGTDIAWSGNWSDQFTGIGVSWSYNSHSPYSYQWLDNITITGTGTNPFQQGIANGQAMIKQLLIRGSGATPVKFATNETCF